MHMQVWVVNLILYSTLPKDINVGEAWMNPASWIQLFGFSLLLAGTIIYAQVGSPRPTLMAGLPDSAPYDFCFEGARSM